jgi:IclR family transcriptional regulator, mhp operon transcriptional activator
MNQAAVRSEYIKSLGKGLSVLIAINEMGPARISTLVKTTSLPKPTLIRIVNTLVAEGFVVKQRGQESGSGYTATSKVRRLSSAFSQGSLLAQVAQSQLNDLCEIIKWPSEILIPDGLSMVIEVGNRHVSPITLKYFEQQRFPIISSASGRAYLWGLPSRDQQNIIAAAADLSENDENFGTSYSQIESAIEEVGLKGYCFQDYEAPIAGTRAYAVPLMQNNRSIGALTMPSLRDVLSLVEFEESILPKLKEAADNLSKELALHG